MRSNKRKIVFGCIIAVLVVIIVLCSTVFTVKSIEVNFLAVPNTLDTEDVQQTIIDNQYIKYNESVFFLSKSTATAFIEENIPYIKVINIEIEFPSIAKVNCIERQPGFYLGITDSAGNYAVVDNELKVLKTQSTMPIGLVHLVIPSLSSIESGMFLNFDDSNYIIELLLKFQSVNLGTSALCNTIGSIEITERVAIDGTDKCAKLTTKNGAIINVLDLDNKLSEKLYVVNTELSNITTGTEIDIFEKSDGTIGID